MTGSEKGRLYRRLAAAVKVGAAVIILAAGSYQFVLGNSLIPVSMGDLRALLSLTFDDNRQLQVSWGPTSEGVPAPATDAAPVPLGGAVESGSVGEPPVGDTAPVATAQLADAATEPQRSSLAVCSLADRYSGPNNQVITRATVTAPAGGSIDGYGIRDLGPIAAEWNGAPNGYVLPALFAIQSQGALSGLKPAAATPSAGVAQLPNTGNAIYPGSGAIVLGVAHEALDLLEVGHGSYINELNPWYHILNAGMRTQIVGGLSCSDAGSVEAVAPLTAGVSAQRAAMSKQFDEQILYVSDGRSALTRFDVNGKGPDRRVGSEVRLDAPGVATVAATLVAELPVAPDDAASPAWDVEQARYGATRSVVVEVVVNGKVVATKPVPANGVPQDVKIDIPIERSSWVALRLMGAGHSNPVYVLVDNEPIRASRSSIEWSRRALLQAYSEERPGWSTEEAPVAAAAFKYAYEFYGGILAETELP